jgi:polyphosphate kinase
VHGLTENVRMRSIIGRFLEHSRIYHLRRSARGEFLIGSADWMHRNLSERVEAVVPDQRASSTARLWEVLRDVSSGSP